jgi:putative transposase
MLKAIHAREGREAADRKARTIVDDLRPAKMNSAADLVERSVDETEWFLTWLRAKAHSVNSGSRPPRPQRDINKLLRQPVVMLRRKMLCVIVMEPLPMPWPGG